jgi:hypothetical protein
MVFINIYIYVYQFLVSKSIGFTGFVHFSRFVVVVVVVVVVAVAVAVAVVVIIVVVVVVCFGSWIFITVSVGAWRCERG